MTYAKKFSIAALPGWYFQLYTDNLGVLIDGALGAGISVTPDMPITEIAAQIQKFADQYYKTPETVTAVVSAALDLDWPALFIPIEQKMQDAPTLAGVVPAQPLEVADESKETIAEAIHKLVEKLVKK